MCCLLAAVNCVWFAGLMLFVRVVAVLLCCLVFAVCWLLCVVCRCIVCCLPFGVCCLLFSYCCLLVVVWCLSSLAVLRLVCSLLCVVV